MSYIFRKPARPVSRVFIHCSASDNPAHDSAAVIDAWHKANGWAGIGYHFFIRKDGTLEIGRDLEKTPAAQEGNNVGTIAICLSGLESEKFTEAQFAMLRALCDQINRAYGILKVTFHGHCEVSAKTCPVVDYRAVLSLTAAGTRSIRGPDPVFALPTVNLDGGSLEVLPKTEGILRLGDKGPNVLILQRLLTGLGYFVGALDGDFGSRTRAALLAFQADNHLVADGIFGPLSREALGEASPRAVAPARASAGLVDLAAGGSRIASASVGNGIAGALLGGGGAVAVLDQLTGSISAITGQADTIQRLFAEHGLLTGGVILAAGLFVAWQSWRAGQARVEDHRTGKTF